MHTIKIESKDKEQIIDITSNIKSIVKESGIKEGICIIYSPHTTAGITINENADPDVKHDVLLSLKDIVKNLGFRHSEGNSDAHVKTILTGKSAELIITQSQLNLGTWDGIYFCEFDGPRQRRVNIKIITE